MLQNITSIYLVDTMIHTLFRSPKSQIAKETINGQIMLKSDPLLSEFLNIYTNNRKKMTSKIAEQLKLRFQYHLHPIRQFDTECNDNIDFDFMFRSILYLYNLTSVDLTYLCADKETDAGFAEHRCEQLTIFMNSVISGFVKKSELTHDELINIVPFYRMEKICNNVSIYPEINKITWLNMQLQYFNFYHNYSFNALLKSEESCTPYIEPSIFRMINPQESYSVIRDELINKIKLSIETANGLIKLIKDILSASSIDVVRQIHPELHHPSGTLKIKSWRYQLLKQNWILRKINSCISYIPSWIGHGDCFEQRYHHLSVLYTDFQKIVEQYCDKDSDEFILIHDIDNCIKEQINLILLQMHLYQDCGKFGLWYDKANIQRVHTTKELVRNMIEFLFKGNTNKIGTIEPQTNLYTETTHSTITYFLSGENTQLNDNRIDRLIKRVQYYLYQKKRKTSPKQFPLTPLQFTEQLWQFYYYSFGLDFFMLRPDRFDPESGDTSKIKDWDKLVSYTLKYFLNNKNEHPFIELKNKLHDILLKKREDYDALYAHRFSEEELSDIRYMNMIAEHYFETVASKIIKIPDPDIEPADVAMIKIRKNLQRLMIQLKRTVTILINLLKSESEEEFIQLCGAKKIYVKGPLFDNWKVSIYYCMTDTPISMVSTCMSHDGLVEFLKTLGAICVGNHVNDGNIKLGKYKDTLSDLLSKTNSLTTIYTNTEHKLYKSNESFLNEGILQKFHEAIKWANNYLIYYEWQMKNIKWKQ